MCLLIRLQALLLCAYLDCYEGSHCDRSFLRNFEKQKPRPQPEGEEPGTQIDHQLMKLIKNRALASNTFRKEEKKNCGKVQREQKRSQSLRLVLRFAFYSKEKKNSRMNFVGKTRSDCEKRFPSFLPAICIQRREICIALIFCMHFVFTLSVCMCSCHHVSIPGGW